MKSKFFMVLNIVRFVQNVFMHFIHQIMQVNLIIYLLYYLYLCFFRFVCCVQREYKVAKLPKSNSKFQNNLKSTEDDKDRTRYIKYKNYDLELQNGLSTHQKIFAINLLHKGMISAFEELFYFLHWELRLFYGMANCKQNWSLKRNTQVDIPVNQNFVLYICIPYFYSYRIKVSKLFTSIFSFFTNKRLEEGLADKNIQVTRFNFGAKCPL